MSNLVPSLSPEVFNQGAVRVNSDALANYIVNTQARRQAQDQAFGKYIQNQNNNINEKGVRAQDLPDILAAKNDWNDFLIKNKQAIQHMNDGGRASVTAMQKYNKIKDIIARSQGATQNHQEFQNAIQNKELSNRIDLEAAADDLTKAKLPVEHGYEPFDITKHISEAPWTTQDQQRYTHELNTNVPTPKESPIGDGIDLGNGFLRIPYSREVSGDQKKQIGALGVQKYNTDPHYRAMINSEMNQPNFHDAYEPLNDIYKKVYGKDIENERDMAAAHALQSHSSATTYEKDIRKPVERPSPEEKNAANFDLFKKKTDYRNAHRPAKAASTKAADTFTPIEDDWNAAITAADKAPKEKTITRVDGTVEHYDILPLTPKQLAAFNSKGSDGKVHQAVAVGISKDRKTAIPIFEKGATSPTGSAALSELSTPISADQAKYTMGKTNYGANQVLKEKKILSAAQPPHGNTITQNGFTYTWNPKTKKYE